MKLFKTLTFCLLAGFSLMANAQNIAVVDIESAIANSAYAKSELDKLEKDEDFKKNYDIYSGLGAEINELQKSAKANGLTWSEEQKKSFKTTIESKVTEINKVGKVLDAQKVAVEREIQKAMMPKIKKIITEIINDKKLDVLLKSNAVYYNNDSSDITRELVDRLNKTP